uniref:Neuralized E3 ubiquitin protein ligase 1Ab n=1 Tax=Cyprinus carpio TaxID=7962 RepID=A0A8C1V9H0_CYPCA
RCLFCSLSLLDKTFHSEMVVTVLSLFCKPSTKLFERKTLPATPPICFHANTKGSQIMMDKMQRSVCRIASFCNAITFTNRPVRIYEQVRLKRQGCWNGALRVGFSTVDPSDLSSAWLPQFTCPDLVSERGFWARAILSPPCFTVTYRLVLRPNNSILCSSASESSRCVLAKLSRDCMWPFLRSGFFLATLPYKLHLWRFCVIVFTCTQ